MANKKNTKTSPNIEAIGLHTNKKVALKLIGRARFLEPTKLLENETTIDVPHEKKPVSLLTNIRENLEFLYGYCDLAASVLAFGGKKTDCIRIIQEHSGKSITLEIIDDLEIFNLAETMFKLSGRNDDSALKNCMLKKSFDYRVIKAICILAAIPIEERLEAEKSRLKKFGGRKNGAIAEHTKFVCEVLKNDINGANKELWKQLKSAIDSNESTDCPLWLDDDVIRFSGKDKEYTFSAFEKTMVNLRKNN